MLKSKSRTPRRLSSMASPRTMGGMIRKFPQNQIEELRQIYFEVFERQISVEEAVDVANTLMDLHATLKEIVPMIPPEVQALLKQQGQFPE